MLTSLFSSNNPPIVKQSTEYFKSPSGIILGGITTYTISGTIIPDNDCSGSVTGSVVMQQLADIRDNGRTTKCINVTIPGFFSGKGKIRNVSIEQGPDPTWVSQGAYSIEIETSVDNIPVNTLGITKDDYVKSIDIIESIEIGEDSHGYFYAADNFSKSFVKFSASANITCEPICNEGQSPLSLAISVLNRLYSCGPTNPAFSQYTSWGTFLNSRSLTLNTDGSVSFSCSMILRPPGGSSDAALVDLSFNETTNYNNRKKSKSISGSIEGLAPINWSGLIDLADTCSSSKISAAISVFTDIKSKYSDISSWKGISLPLQRLPDCPPTNNQNDCVDLSIFNPETDLCVKPLTSSVSSSRTDGKIDFNFEWSSSEQSCGESNDTDIETSIEKIDPQEQIAEIIIPEYGTLIQKLNCKSAPRLIYTQTISSKSDSIDEDEAECLLKQQRDNPDLDLQKILSSGNWTLISNTRNRSFRSITIRQEYIECVS